MILHTHLLQPVSFNALKLQGLYLGILCLHSRWLYDSFQYVLLMSWQTILCMIDKCRHWLTYFAKCLSLNVCHTIFFTQRMSHIIFRSMSVTHYLSYIICHSFYLSLNVCHTLSVTQYLSPIIFHTLSVTQYFSFNVCNSLSVTQSMSPIIFHSLYAPQGLSHILSVTQYLSLKSDRDWQKYLQQVARSHCNDIPLMAPSWLSYWRTNHLLHHRINSTLVYYISEMNWQRRVLLASLQVNITRQRQSARFKQWFIFFND